MSKIVYLIKNKLDSAKPKENEQILANAEYSLTFKEKKYYNTTNDVLSENKNQNLIMLISYRQEGDIDSIYLGEAELVEKKVCNNADEIKRYNIHYLMKKCIKNENVIKNLLDNVDLSLVDDYESKSYVLESKMKSLVKQIEELLSVTIDQSIKINYKKVYDDNYNDYSLAKYAQHNEQCRRLYNIREEAVYRNEFQRDRERIVNSKAFRRLVDKAQIFSAEKGDHYRTRMTHTLEVNQIAKAIALAMNLNLDLTEAIALGHDIGHTPFGHQGERTLKEILSSDIDRVFHIDNIGDSKSIDIFGGFKHNYQSIRVLTKLEEKYIEYSGLDISEQVLEGILKHTKLKDVVVEKILEPQYIEGLHLEKQFSTSLEGQVVAIADEIAQRGHDVDDAISSRLITVEELLEGLNLAKFLMIHQKLSKEKEELEKNQRIYINERELITGRIISCIVGYFINDVIVRSKKNIELYTIDYSDGIFEESLISFSEAGKAVCDYLEKLINKKVINNAEVACFDYNASVIIKKLFLEYYKNPNLLQGGTLRRIYADMLYHDDERVSSSAIDLRNSNLDIAQNEIFELNEKDINFNCIDENDMEYVRFEKRKILVRNIVDYIAGMTDSYALCEYNRIK